MRFFVFFMLYYTYHMNETRLPQLDSTQGLPDAQGNGEVDKDAIIEELQKTVAEQKIALQNAQAQQTTDAQNIPPAQTATEDITASAEKAFTDSLEKKTAQEQMSGRQTTEGYDTMKAEIDSLKKMNEVQRYARENNITADAEKIITEGVVNKGLSMKEATAMARGMLAPEQDAVGVPSPGESLSDIKKSKKTPHVSELSPAERAAAAEAEMKAMHDSGATMTA